MNKNCCSHIVDQIATKIVCNNYFTVARQ